VSADGLRVLIAGESWMSHTTHVKGFDSFTTSTYAEGVGPLRDALDGHQVRYLPNHVAMAQFPHEVEQLKAHDAVILSDIGANTLLLHPEVFANSKAFPNRLNIIADYVRSGGGLLMVGGYLSFQGIEAKANYRGTQVESVLPVQIEASDDRVEVPQGVTPRVLDEQHPIVHGLGPHWPKLLGYNRVVAKRGADVLVECDGHPLIVVMRVGEGRSAVFTSDCGPHWAPPVFLEWNGYKPLWQRLVRWVAGRL
jgi:uncharacterized membrane protein